MSSGPDISGVMVQELALGWIHKTSTCTTSREGPLSLCVS